MKILNTILLASLAFPLVSQAGNLVYPDAVIQLNEKAGSSMVQKVSDALNLGLDAQSFRLSDSRTSLLGNHYYFQQTANGHDIEGAQLVVSVDESGVVSKIYNATSAKNLKSHQAAIPFISQDMAIQAAWSNLQVTGELLDAPKVKLQYSADLKLVYQINLSTSAPYGHWIVSVDAQSGNVLDVRDEALPRMKRAETPVHVAQKGALVSFSSALKKFEKKSLKEMLPTSISFVDGTAQVFDPNPVITLGRVDLQDTTDASVFLPAYRNETLKDISYVNGVYALRGPKVTLIDFESPAMAPSTSPDGSWIFERKNPKFNDAMTYLHIDRSVRYIESMGFVGGRAVFTRSIEVDANGVNGQDNSHYIPSSRRLAFGHGCVDDNEDADVILHELGHAIQHHINPSWYGGDTGAMGEGFGDYWAASYSVTTDGGLNTQPNWVFKWDGHNACWPGRKLNSFSPVYNSSRSYPAHARVDGGISDEMWSTPIFQAFLELYTRGVPRSHIDKIILEAHFGLGSGVKMPVMAQSIVNTAKKLFPNSGYDQVYLRHFQKQKMLP